MEEGLKVDGVSVHRVFCGSGGVLFFAVVVMVVVGGGDYRVSTDSPAVERGIRN